jgi:hypothetical protein
VRWAARYRRIFTIEPQAFMLHQRRLRFLLVSKNNQRQ